MHIAQNGQFTLDLVTGAAGFGVEGFGGRETLARVGHRGFVIVLRAPQPGIFAILTGQQQPEHDGRQAEQHNQKKKGRIHTCKGRLFLWKISVYL